jgi:hypothetical protein
MCGRFVQKTPLGEIRVLFETANAVPNAAARYNAAPTDSLAVVRYNPQTRQRSLDLLRWGLVPLWAKDIAFGVRCINAPRRKHRTDPGVPRRLRAAPLHHPGRRLLRMAEARRQDGALCDRAGRERPLRLGRAVGAVEEPG